MSIDRKFQAAFGKAPEASRFTPGRVNLIGEHTDYNGGMVLPTALPLGLTIALSRRGDDAVHIQSDKFDKPALRNVHDAASDHWSDYITGAIALANDAGLLQGGADITVETTLPFGAGLSSSAAVIVGVLKIARDLSRQTRTDTEIAVLARRVENEYIGVPCGIMDQMAVAISRPGQALALDTQSLDYAVFDLPEDHKMAVIHSGIYRQLSEGRYKTRKEECDVVKAFLGRDDLCRMTDTQYQSLTALPQHIQRRAKHVRSEHRRTQAAISALKSKDMKRFGALMEESHVSMRDDFEITVPAIDALVAGAIDLGALGARMTGGGFGGCIVACVASDNLERWKTDLLAHHRQAFFVC